MVSVPGGGRKRRTQLTVLVYRRRYARQEAAGS
jgi:hypothetical protein